MRIRHLLTTAVMALAAVVAVTVAVGTDVEAVAPTSIPTPQVQHDPPAPPERTPDAGGLQPGLAAALSRARDAASTAGVDLPVASGYRSAAEQAALLEREIAERGSREAALHWVFEPEDSMHVRGLAIDVNSGPGADWLDRHGAIYGLCRTLDWEWWHFEWRERWEAAGTCPAPATTPADAPPP